MLSCNTAWNVYSRKRLLVALRDAGWELITLAAEDDNAESIRNQLGMPFISLPMKSDSTSIVQDSRLFIRYLKLYRKYRPRAVLHINNKPNIYGTLAADILGIPSISNITGLGIVAEKSGIMKRLVYSLYRTAFASRKARVFFQNNEDRSFFLRNRLIHPDKTTVIPGSGVDTERFKPVPGSPCPAGHASFLFNGRLLISKGIEDFIEAARRIKKLYPDCTFTIIGEHDPENQIFISKESLQLAVNDGTIQYKGSVQSVEETVTGSDCVVLPSRYREGVPRALLEAASMGKPLIAADSVGTREPVDHGENGYIVPPADPDALAEAMIRFITLSSGEKKLMGEHSRKIAVERFADSFVIDSYRDMLDSITNRNSAKDGK